MTKVLVVATSRKTRGGITSVVKAHETGGQWKKNHCRWIETHRDGPVWRKFWYFIKGTIELLLLLPFYDIIHMHVSFAGSLTRKCIYLWLARLFHKKTIVHFHPPTPDVLKVPKYKTKYTYLFGKADRVLVLSKKWKEWICSILELDGNNIEVLYNPCHGVSDDEIVPLNKRGKYILFAGALIERKGYKSLILGFSHIANMHADSKLVLAGVDEEHEAAELIEELGIKKQVNLAGWCDKKRMKELYRNASVFCLASSGEGFPMVVLEAWAYGVPVVCTPVGGLPDIIEEGVNALSFEFNNDEQLGSQLNRIINDEELRKK